MNGVVKHVHYVLYTLPQIPGALQSDKPNQDASLRCVWVDERKFIQRKCVINCPGQ